MSETPLLIERRDSVAILTMNRPDQRNALDLTMRDALSQAVYDIRDNTDVKAVVLTGAGQAFCAGGDIRSITSGKLDGWGARERIRRLHNWLHPLINLEKPVIAAVNGAAFGGGLNLALAADFILCSERARLCASFARIGLVPDMGGFFLLPRMIGLQRAKELIYSAREFDGHEAVALGIAYAVRPAETLVEDAIAMAQTLSRGSTEAQGMAKTILNQSFHMDQFALSELEAHAQSIALGSEYYGEATRRFMNKEAPLFLWDVPFGPGSAKRHP